ncbi:MAG TPA: response regulator [bacterium]|nr:response regulator [bacterium]HOL48273.1 response regulator [bacterium]HPQ19444.1 response regulator [bacterium]
MEKTNTTKKILIIDDEKYILLVTKYNLKNAGYDVLIANNGEEGIKIAQTELPDLILLDLMMPLVDGFQVIRTLRADESTKSIPIIILTARGSVEDKNKVYEYGANDYLLKPFSVQQLLEKIKSFFNQNNK